MADSNITPSNDKTPQEEFTDIAIKLCVDMNSFFQLAEREIKENNNTDFENLEFLVKSARAEINSFEERIIEEEMAKQEVTSSVGTGKPGPTTENTEGATSRYDLACDMSGELHTLRDLLEIAADRAYAGKDGKLVSLFVSAMPRMNKAVELCEKLELAS